MTALDEYDRLEAVGTLKLSGEDDGTEVLVTFGEATLTMNALSETGDTPITHWSLAAIDLIDETETRATYSLNAMTQEALVIEDQTFRRALAKVLQDRKTPATRAKAPKTLWFLGGTIAVLGAAYLVLPGAVTHIAKAMISPERAAVLADEMLPMIEDRTGPACTSAPGVMALEQLADRLNPDGNTRLFVHDLGDTEVISLPGGKVLINRSVIETAQTDTITAWAAVGIASVIESPAITELFEGQGLFAGLKFLSSGELPKSGKERAVNRLLGQAGPQDPVVIENAAQLLINAQLPTDGLTALGGQTAPMATSSTAVMSEQDWAALQNICSG